MDFGIFIVAMAALIYGADFIIKESERIALHYNISHFVIGATLVAFGTSLPEMAASMMASSQGKSDMAVANVVGSVIFNITLVLGVVFFISKKMVPNRDLFSLDSAWIIVPLVLFFVMVQDGVISRVDGSLYLLLMVAYLLFLFTNSREDLEGDIDESLTKEKFKWGKTIVLLSIGFVLTIGGANFVVESGTAIARTFGVSEWIIGIFLIALGTSLPELVVSLVAIKKGNAEMSIGNIIGSNVANFSMVLGAASLINPLTVDLVATKFDMFILVAASITLLFILANKLYNKTGSIFLLVILALFLQNSFA
ncbi:MAG: calcium/sodium antiporter [Epsilonproteobacteria bacterium]|nr:calcium/sodium antiporter [Campylobacterota bacterium]OIO14428.1 MAG: sodium:proton exchanger [Helicobacteraceae bacterium CG1_02_36_14]PIP09909.1 MAG: sodium:proton exchanger [Sulfurimonas sp. CG23_combo_of_CG06-09_8_20_14_all_36_33]PIS24733.1 MAG: sodium:proton exchanger [Sulfurimonas sp. CG08_land_8_20_14_0_20_36_33]PIU35952.1 MAG: sodium:proton exchanger [Sulfurimonas sp. CG07_land_8_20_14_0_80_36_56]PIV03010.1 MAG: sodium:proton exchanger [Sulfurimonas sp. CG03_land_8_20_14_0_80_36_25]